MFSDLVFSIASDHFGLHLLAICNLCWCNMVSIPGWPQHLNNRKSTM